jgi:hypothetical protein
VNPIARRSAVFFALFSGACALAACGTAASPPQCGAPKGAVTMAYPAPSSTGIPDNFPGVIFASTNGLGSSYQAIVQIPGQSLKLPLERVQPISPPLPTPNVVPPFANPTYQLSSSGQILSKLHGATKYFVYLNDANSNCNPTFMGSFTFQ